ncbi:exodeoxyribonuclease VII small subunit [Methylobacterium sp. ID0610]|uniref:exodeoxyribonuclease VII small subunit n=1 Tax=Methylobacterium carpenticola TaxID=3344827 RepID=UPI0036797DCC
MTAARSDAASTAPSSGPAVTGDLPFETALEELEGIVQRLEQGNVPLDESVAIYERGEALKRHCEQLLQRAEARIQRITLGADGNPVGTAPLDVA